VAVPDPLASTLVTAKSSAIPEVDLEVFNGFANVDEEIDPAGCDELARLARECRSGRVSGKFRHDAGKMCRL
jgi:hypothetical protein